jgi:phosphonate transport system substrate-binding protein
MPMSRTSLAALVSFASLLAGCSDTEVGTESRPFTMYFVPSRDADTIAESAEEIEAFVARHVSRELYGKDKGFHVETAIPASYVAVVEAFGTGRADFAAMNTFGYILAKDVKQYPVEAILTVVRGTNETHYKGQIIAHVDNGITRVEQLQGKKFAFTDAASTAGFILPSKLLRERGVTLGETVFSGNYDSVVMQVYQKSVDAGATYYSPPRIEQQPDGTELEFPRDARARVATQYPDVFEKVKIVEFTSETPNDAWVMRRGIYGDTARDKALRDSVRAALFAFAATPEGKASLGKLYDITGLSNATDSTYDEIRKVVLESDLDLEGTAK